MTALQVVMVLLLVTSVGSISLTNSSERIPPISGKTINSTCIASRECLGKLACIEGHCDCSEDHYWIGNNCLQKKSLNSLCSEQYECGDTLFCHYGKCQCNMEDYWNGFVCFPKSTMNSTCQISRECSGKLLCLDKTCQCPQNYYWDNGECSLIRVIGSPCTDNSGCYDSLYCIYGTCQCAGQDYWTPNRCLPRKSLQSVCVTSYECFGKLVCIKGRCLCSEQHFWNGTNCQTLQTPDSTCNTAIDCGETMICSHGKCQCAQEDYWNGRLCEKRKGKNSTCSMSAECKKTLECLNGVCDCIPTNLIKWTGEICSYSLPRECEDLDTHVDGVYKIFPFPNQTSTLVYCKMENKKKWTVIQRRFDGSVDFYRTWYEYKVGFGSVFGEYWLGNDAIHAISDHGYHELSIYMEIASGEHHTANYSTFHVGNEQSKYILNLTGWSGTNGDCMDQVSSRYKANGQRFSTKDQDNDNSSGSCAATTQGGWWYSDCYYADFNKKYSSGMNWAIWSGSITKSILMIRRL